MAGKIKIYTETRFGGTLALVFLCLVLIFGLCILVIRMNRKKDKRRIYLITVFLVLYLGFLLFITIIGRSPKGYKDYRLIPFWSYKDYVVRSSGAIMQQVFLNILVMFPWGMFGPILIKGKHRILYTVLSALLFSVLVEFTQLLTTRGVFEFDDMIHNTLGALIGCGMYKAAEWIAEKGK